MSGMLIGSGKIQLVHNRIGISAIFAPALTANSFGELRCEWDERIYSAKSHRMKGSNITVHELINRRAAEKLTITKRCAPDCRVTNMPLPEASMVLRLIESTEGVTFRMIPSEKAEFKLLSDYSVGGAKRSVGVITLRSGEGRCEVCRLYLIPIGEVHFDSMGNLSVSPGRAALILAVGRDPAEIISAASKLIGRLELHLPVVESRLYEESSAYWRRRLSVLDRKPQWLREISEECALLLLAHFSPDGKSIAGHSLMRFSDCAAVIECLAELGFTDEARAAADLIAEETSHSFSAIQRAEAQLAYYRATGDDAFLRLRLPVLIRAAMELCGKISDNLLHFRGDEKIFTYGMLSPDAFDQASAAATLRFITLAEAVISFVTEHGLRARKGYFEALTKSCRLVKAAFMNEFYSDGMLWENNPRRRKYQRKPRFIYAVCAVCGKADHLERENSGHYVCLACRGKPLPSCNYPDRIPAVTALAYARGVLPDGILAELACIHAKRLLEGSDKLVEGSASGVLLRLMSDLISTGSGNDELRRLCRVLYEHILAEGTIRAGCYRTVYSPIDEADPAATAKCMLGLLAAIEIL
ncbi:MAG: hypothetical protein IJA85_04235 [Clostridia bacterium]|nr:hypothetical protein [Clostridia bacterium]